MENSNSTSTPTSGRGALAVMNSPSGLVTVDDSEPTGPPKPLLTPKRDRKGNYVLVGTSEEAELGREHYLKVQGDTEGLSAVLKPSGMDMAGTPDVPPSRDARPLE
eukprot:2748110-Pleurochrysis_carterae.AAC.2